MGVPSKYVEARLHKFSIYEPGAMTKPQKASERETGIVDTLDVCLPSQHT